MKKIALFLLTTLLLNHASAQHNWCGLSADDAKELTGHFLQVREDMRDYVHERGVVTYVPVRFFLVAKSDGTGRASERLALQALCVLNEAYLDIDIQFYLKEFKYLNSTAVHSNPESFSGFNTISSNVIYNAINVFIVNEIADPGVAAYYQLPPGPGGNDWIIASDNYVTSDNVLPHEVGHFFSLLHTFNGWESSGGWNPSVHGNPVGNNSPDGVPNEYVNGSNCTTAGDFICDTPADYMFGPSNTCIYNKNAKDPTGALLTPAVKNRMNYFDNCDEYLFSNAQIAQINNSLFHPNRNYVRPGITPTLATVSAAPGLVQPASNAKVDTYNNVELKWNPVAGANKYLVEISNSSIGNVRYIVSNTSLLLTDLPADQTFLWRVMAYNEYSTCANYSSQRIFKTGNIFSDVQAIEELDDWKVAPNPVRSGQALLVQLESSESLEATVSLFSAAGQLMQEYRDYRFPAGISSLEMATDQLPAGLYLLTLRTASGLETKRVAVVD